VTDGGDLAAGDFSAWLVGMRAAIRGEQGSDVPCGSCTACCTSSQFIHVEPDETDTLAYIPAELLFPAPGLPRGHVVMGYDERGHCPMLVANECSIYEHRPRTCRTYDCRIFAAAGLSDDDEGEALIAQQARRWRFGYPTARDRAEHEAVRATAARLRERDDASATRIAVLAIEQTVTDRD
jgi:Fe-S-cluster containining protein